MEELRQRGADRGAPHLQFVDQQVLDVDVAGARGAGALFQLGGRQHRLVHQGVVLAAHPLRTQALAERHRQGVAQLAHAVQVHGGEGAAVAVVDELDHAQQLAVRRLQGRDQHRAGAVAGALVDPALELQLGRQPAQLGLVVDIGDRDHPARQRHETGHRAGRDRQAQVAERAQAGLDPGDDVVLLGRDRVQGEALAVEQVAEVHAQAEHDLLDVGGGVDAGGDLLQPGPEGQAPVGAGIGVVHRSSTSSPS